MSNYVSAQEHERRLNICTSSCWMNGILKNKPVPRGDIKNIVIENWKNGYDLYEYPTDDPNPTYVCSLCGCAVVDKAGFAENHCPAGLW
ncbi:MAG: hypothetical protein NT007_09665 [Candidatus Kapabacteria bacterium]|nr:hypothetical protein [Candidatus Kapabacteria bacterium]